MQKSKWLAGFMLIAFIGVFLAPALLAQEAAPAAGGAPAVAANSVGLELTGDAPKAPENVAKMDLYHVIFRSGWFGVLIWVLLLGASMVGVALIVDSFLTIREKKIAPQALVEAVREAMTQGDVVKAIEKCKENPGPLANVLTAGFSNVTEGFEVVQDATSVAGDLESEKMMQRVTYLSLISNTTPMLGLIGTVQGMIYAFFTLATQAAGAAQQSSLALSISHGLWATAVGLTVAVITTIFYYIFKNRAVRIILEMEAMTLDLVKSLRNAEVVQE